MSPSQFSKAANGLVSFVHRNGLDYAAALAEARRDVDGYWRVERLVDHRTWPANWFLPSRLTELVRTNALSSDGLRAREMLLAYWDDICGPLKERLAEAAAREARLHMLVARIDRAKPFLDAHVLPGQWPPSSVLSILLIMACSGEDTHGSRLKGYFENIAEWVEAKLAVARDRYRDGFFANPFGDPIYRKAAA